MKTVKLGDFLLWKGKLMTVIGTMEDNKVAILQLPDAEPCACCGNVYELNVVVRSPQFQDNAEPVPTITN